MSAIRTYAQSKQFFLFYLLGFLILWTAARLGLFWYFRDNVVLEFLVKLGIWVGTPLLYLWFVDRKRNLWNYLHLNQINRWSPLWILIGVLLVKGMIAMAFLAGTRTPQWHNLNADALWNVIFLAGFAEEILCRGFIFQKAQELWESREIGILTNTLIFALSHIPLWWSRGDLDPGNVIFIVLFALVTSYIFVWSKSLWNVLIVHWLNNLLAVLV